MLIFQSLAVCFLLIVRGRVSAELNLFIWLLDSTVGKEWLGFLSLILENDLVGASVAYLSVSSCTILVRGFLLNIITIGRIGTLSTAFVSDNVSEICHLSNRNL